MEQIREIDEDIKKVEEDLKEINQECSYIKCSTFRKTIYDILKLLYDTFNVFKYKSS
jgi:hypothetical protein